jgi:hypothetical protein
MVRPLLALTLFYLLTATAWAIPVAVPVLSAGQLCRAGIAAAERGHGVPAQLMSAIGRVESGRRDPATGEWGAWPWTINAEGQGYYFESKAEAIKTVEELRARGMRSIDVGCMQVNLMHHPTAFANLDQAFEPAVNADYAARFLVQLYGQTGDWTKATANYHSANPAEGGPYAAKVTALWPEEQRRAGQLPPLPLPFGHGPTGLFASATVLPFPTHQPPRLLAMAGTPFGMAPGSSAGGLAPGSGPLSPGQAGPVGTAPGNTPGNGASAGSLAAAMATFGARPVQPGAIAGHSLDFYRGAPVRMLMPVRTTLRMPDRVVMR